jgi:ABC-type branched-subunit amino acid transport system ATPase component
MPTSSADGRGTPHLVLSDVSAGYGGVPVIFGIDLTVCAGETVAVIGPNGAGKSTLLKAVIGVLGPLAGSITLGGERIGGLRTDQIVRKHVGYVPQVKDVFEPLTVEENLEMGGYALPRSEVRARIDELLELYPALGLMRDRHAANLSGGERKMLATARVLMTRPTLLVLDEPTAGLSPKLAHEFLSVHVADLSATGVAILLVEQRAREALAISDWAYVMSAGEIQLADKATAVLAREDIGQIFLGRAAEATA